MIWALLCLWAACTGPQTVDVAVVAGGLEVQSDAPIVLVEVYAGPDLVVRQRPGESVHSAWVSTPATGSLTVHAHGRGGIVRLPVRVPPTPPLSIQVQAPLGQAPRAVVDGDRIEVVVVDGSGAQALIVVDSDAARSATMTVGNRHTPMLFHTAGDRRTFVVPLAEAMQVVVSADESVAFTIEPSHVSALSLREQLQVTGVVLPATGLGEPDPTRPASRIDVAAPWWSGALARWGFGTRARDDQAPWTHQAVHLKNGGDRDVVVAVTASVHRDGQPDPAFASRVREAALPGGEVAVLARVPAGGSSVAVLPVFVDRSQVQAGLVMRHLTVHPLGASEPLHDIALPLAIRRGSGALSAGFAIALTTSLLGLLFIGLRGRRWLRSMPTSDLVTIALFGSLTFVVAAASRLLGFGVASVLGPFAPFLTGILDDAFRVALLCALVTLVPRVGVVGLATLTGYLLRGIALGSFHPVDLLYFGNTVLFHEALLWLVGVTRSGAWRDDAPGVRFARLAVGFASANALATASGLVTTMVIYRLFFADWYIAAIVALPGFAYVVVGCLLAVPFAASLRKVAA